MLGSSCAWPWAGPGFPEPCGQCPLRVQVMALPQGRAVLQAFGTSTQGLRQRWTAARGQAHYPASSPRLPAAPGAWGGSTHRLFLLFPALLCFALCFHENLMALRSVQHCAWHPGGTRECVEPLIAMSAPICRSLREALGVAPRCPGQSVRSLGLLYGPLVSWLKKWRHREVKE